MKRTEMRELAFKTIYSKFFNPDADENGEPLLGSEDITIFKEADGTYTIHVDGTDIYIPISEEEAEFNLEGGAKLIEK